MLKVYVNVDYCVEPEKDDEETLKRKAAVFFKDLLEQQPMEVLSVEEEAP